MAMYALAVTPLIHQLCFAHFAVCQVWYADNTTGTICHNEVFDLTATLLTEVCHIVATKPALQPITAETFPYSTANISDDASFDVKARNFGCRGQDTFLMQGHFIQMHPIIIL